MIAGWARLKHPELIHAAMASSAPVKAQYDYPEYYNHITYAYSVSNNDVGGSTQCMDAIAAGHRKLEKMFETSHGTSEAEHFFNLETGKLATKEARRDFAGDGVASFPAQSNSITCTEPGCNIKNICKIMVDTTLGDELDRLKILREKQCASSNSNLCKENSSFSSRRKDLWLAGRKGSHDEWYDASWDYQTCAEFGFYQTCELNSTCMFVRGLVDLKYVSSVCDAQFNISRGEVETAIARTNAHYGALKPSGVSDELGTCVMWINGEVDPWSTLGVKQSPSHLQPTLEVPGADHCAWVYRKDDITQKSVLDAREVIRGQVKAFLAQECGESSVTLV